MKRAVSASESIAVFGAISALRHVRSTNRSVSMTGPVICASAAPGLRGGSLHFLSCFPAPADRPQAEEPPRRANVQSEACLAGTTN